MHRFVRIFFVGAALAVTLGVPANAEVGFGTDVVSRYVWRGADLGNAAAVQPWISYGNDAFEVGAWSSWAINDGGANENDLYVSFGAGPVGITVTDYFNPAEAPADFFDYSDDAGVHIIEVSGALDLGVVSVLGAINLLGDDENSIWVEASLPLEMLTSDDVEVGLTVGAGNGIYTTDTDPMVASVSLDVAKDDWFGSYILNPDAEITFLVIGKSF